jgi:hypothetical protein
MRGRRDLKIVRPSIALFVLKARPKTTVRIHLNLPRAVCVIRHAEIISDDVTCILLFTETTVIFVKYHILIPIRSKEVLRVRIFESG